MTDTGSYLERVLNHIPRCLPGRAGIEADLRSHLADRLEAGETVDRAVAGMGPPKEVARELLRARERELVPATVLRRTGAFLIDMLVAIVTERKQRAFDLVAQTIVIDLETRRG